MSDKITEVQLNANQSVYKIEDYRSMVNYTSGTNKGYVRFTKASDGKLKIEKFNNKIDVPLSWRSNVSPAHNKAVREKFLAAIEGDLRFMGANADRIRSLILQPKGDDGVVNVGKALSRRELKEIFKKFDAEFNTGVGRIAIVENFYKDAMLRCGFTGSKEDFIDKYLKPAKAGIDITKQLYFETDDAHANDADPTKRMKMSETQFRAYLVSLDNLVVTAKHRYDAEKACKGIALAASKVDNGFGLNLPENDVATVRACLTEIFKAEGFQDLDLGFGTAGTGLNLFLKRVLPAMVRQAAENIRDFADAKNQASVEETLEADLSIDRIVEIAKAFIQGARHVVEVVDMADLPDAKEGQHGLMAQLDAVRRQTVETAHQLAVFGDARKAFILNVNAPKGGGEALAKDVGTLTKTYIKEAKIDEFTSKFLMERFAKAVEDEPQEPASFLDKADEHVKELVVAGQLNYGERWVISGTTLDDIKLRGSTGATEYVKRMARAAIDIVNQERGGMPMLDNLLKRTLTNMINLKIRNALASGGAARLFIDTESDQEDIDKMRAAAKAYKKFFHESEQMMVGKAISAFRTQLDRQLKKGNISQDEYNTLLVDYKARLRAALERAAERFFDKTPLSKGDREDLQTVVDRGAVMMQNLFSEEKGEVQAEMRQRLSTIALTNGIGAANRRELLDAKKHVDDCIAALKQAKVEFKGDFKDGEVAVELEKLYFKVLERKLEGKKVGHKTIADKLNASVQDAFVSEAKKFVEGVNKLCDKHDKELAGAISRTVLIALDKNQRGYYRTELGKEELDAMTKSVTEGMMLSLKGARDDDKRKFLQHPDTYAKKADAGAMAMAFFDMVEMDKRYTDENIAVVYNGVVNERHDAVMAWIKNPTGPDGKGTLATDLVTGEKTRVLAADSSVKKYADKLPANELNNILDKAVKDVLAHAERFSISYATGGKEAFMKRINAEIKKAVDARVKAQVEFREAFIRDAQPVLEKYVDALRTETKTGKEVATERMYALLDSLSREKDLPAIKGFALAFDGMLAKALNGKIDMKFAEFLEYSKKVTAAYTQCVGSYEDEIWQHFQQLKDAGATDEDIEFLKQTLMPVLRQGLETEIQNNPDFYAGDRGKMGARMMADGQMGAIASALDDINVSKDMGLKVMVSELGFKELLGSDEMLAVAKGAIATAFKSEAVQKLAGEARRAVMTKYAYRTNDTSAAPKAAQAKLEEYRATIRATVMGLQSTVLEGDFKEFEVEPAVEMFKVWLKKYDLPDIHVSGDFGDGTLEDAAVAHFKKRIADLQQKIAADGSTREPLLSADYLKDFVRYLNKIGRTVIFVSMQGDLLNQRMAEMSQAHSGMYDLMEGEGNEATKEIMAMNRTGLQMHFLSALRRAEKTLRGTVVSLEDMHRWKDLVKEEFDRQVADDAVVINEFHEFARSRVNMMAVIDLATVSGREAIKGYVLAALKDHFGGKDILDESVITQKFLKKHNGSAVAMVEHLVDLAVAKVEESKATLKGLAMEEAKPGELHMRLPELKQLKAMFRLDAETIVDAIASQKKGGYAELFHAVEKKVAGIIKKEAKGGK